jgi:hypothetical protein
MGSAATVPLRERGLRIFRKRAVNSILSIEVHCQQQRA